MKKIHITILAFISCIGFVTQFYSCKKKNSTNPPVNTLCNGNGNSSYYPLSFNNKWSYTYVEDSVAQSTPTELIITKDSFVNGKMYKTFVDASGRMFPITCFIREDSATKNIYFYNPSSAYEYIEVPANPTLNQSWNASFYSRTVTNLSATFKTSSCSYSNLIEITETDASVPRLKRYYKKGLGMVAIVVPQNGALPEKRFLLSAVALK